MDPDRWRQVARVYDDALTREPGARGAFLSEACGNDAELRKEVESLLAHERSAEGFMAGPAVEAAALVMPDEHPSLIGQQFGAFQIVSLLGRGGMGEVYRARDRKLERDVAIKVLPSALASDAERLARFEREARVLASLNHPHIAAIYGFEEIEGRQGLILELVEGVTLSERIDPGMTVADALIIARQIADALQSSHDKGIIHRDLKPANIKVTPNGVVKVLDFGLAKVWTREISGSEDVTRSLVTAVGTRAGVLIGTAAYMSPEQARGQRLDTRTDVWAFGCVLFEMLSGRSPFSGDTLSDTLARVLEREPDWSALARSTPPRVKHLLKRCLHKDPGQRLRDIGEARSDIEASLDSPFKTLHAAGGAIRWGLSRPPARWTLAALASLVLGFTAYQLRDRETPVPRFTNPLQVTNAIGVEDHPTWSPDGRTLAYESRESGNWDIWLTAVAGGAPVNRTVDHSGSDRYLSWSPDGRQVAFWSDMEGGGYFVMPALGGAPTRLIATPVRSDVFFSAPEWSKDGKELAGIVYTVNGPRFEHWAEIVSLVTHDARRLALPGAQEARLDLSWSPDGRYLAYVDAGQQSSELTQMRVLRLADGQMKDATDGRTNARRPRWSADSRYLFYVANREGPADLWRQTKADDGSVSGEPQRVTAGLEVLDAAFSADGARVAYAKGRWVANVWRVPIFEDRPATWADAEQITFEQAFIEFFHMSPDGRSLAYSSDRAGNQDIWIMPLGGVPKQITADPAPDWGPDWSPDGQRLAYYSYRSGDREIWTVPAAGGSATQVTKSPGLDAGPRWSPDGREIAYRSERTGNSEIWVTSTADGRSRQVTNNPAGDYLETWSPDGRWLAFASNRSGRNQIWRVPSEGGEAAVVTQGPGYSPRYSRDGASIFFVGVDERAGNLWRYSFKDRRERPVTSLAGKRGSLNAMRPDTDGKFIYFSWRDDVADLWVMDVGDRPGRK